MSVVLAVLAGAAAAVLVATTVSASYDGGGAPVSCSTVIVAAAVTGAESPDLGTRAAARDQRAADAACHEALVDRTALAGLAVLVCVVAGSAAAFGRPQDRVLAAA